MAVLNLMQEVAEESINPRFRALADGEIHEKSPGDLVTVADREAEETLTRVLQQAYPDAVILGEEAYSADPAIREGFLAADHGFTVDPVDGTKNFVNGSPDHAVMIGEVRSGATGRGEVTRAWIWQPQHRAAYVAERGAGTWRIDEHGRTRLHLPAPAEDASQWRGVTSRWNWVGRGLGELAPLELTWISCGIDYPRLIEGAATYAIYRRVSAWDHVPGSLLVDEAGGASGNFAGADFTPDLSDDLIVAAGSRVLATVRAAIADDSERTSA